jgi:hypothetical protein
MNLRQKQSEFVRRISQLIDYATELGYELTFGDAFATTGHIPNSKHYRRLAIDLNLFKDGIFLETTEDHKPLGEYWEKIGGIWGGRFKNKDGNHYEWPENQ